MNRADVRAMPRAEFNVFLEMLPRYEARRQIERLDVETYIHWSGENVKRKHKREQHEIEGDEMRRKYRANLEAIAEGRPLPFPPEHDGREVKVNARGKRFLRVAWDEARDWLDSLGGQRSD